MTAVQYLALTLPGLARLLRLLRLVEEGVEPGQVRAVSLFLAPVETVLRLTVGQVNQIFLFKLNILQVKIIQSGKKSYLDKNVVMK